MKHVDEPFDNKAEIEDVISAYRLILRRNPEKSGLEHHRHLIEHGGIPLDILFKAFLTSPELKQRNIDDNRILEIDVGGYFVCIRNGEKDFGTSIARNRQWDPHIVNAMSGILREGDTFVDVGANVGIMTFYASKLVGKLGRVIAVEPHPDNLQMLYRGIQKNLTNNVQVLPFAASDKADIFSIIGGTSNSFITEPQDHSNLVQSIILDQHLNNLGRIDLVKLDIEGHELNALNGFRQLLHRWKPVVILEFNPRCLREIERLNPKECLETFFELLEHIQVIEYSGEYIPFEDSVRLWNFWEEKNADAVKSRFLPDGMLHLDLLAKAR